MLPTCCHGCTVVLNCWGHWSLTESNKQGIEMQRSVEMHGCCSVALQTVQSCDKWAVRVNQLSCGSTGFYLKGPFVIEHVVAGKAESVSMPGPEALNMILQSSIWYITRLELVCVPRSKGYLDAHARYNRDRGLRCTLFSSSLQHLHHAGEVGVTRL